MANKGTSYITNPDGIPITDDSSAGSTRTIGEWAGGIQYTYDTQSDAQADPSLEVGSRVVVLGNTSAFDGGGAKLNVMASGGEISLTASGLTASRVDPRVVSRASIESLLQITPYDGMSVCVDAYHASYPSNQLVGGGVFVYSSSRSKSSHDGGYVISSSVPWDWSDDGESFLSGSGDTSPSGSGCWIRCSTGSVNPAYFGARPWQSGDRDTGENSEFSLIAGLDYIISGVGSNTLDLGGQRYTINNPLIPNRTGGVNSCRVTNGEIHTKSTFSGGYFFDFDGNSYVGGRSSFDELRLIGGISGSMPEAEGMIKLPSGSSGFYNTVVISHNEMREFSGICIHGQATAPATESAITGNRIKGSYTGGATTCEGIRWSGNDTEIVGNIIFNTYRNVALEAGGISLIGNHLWNGQPGEPGRINIEAFNSRAVVIMGNYLDNGSVRLHDPVNTMVNDNKFVARQDTIDAWNIDGESHVVLLATTSGFVVKGLSIQGNTFRQETPPTTSYSPFSVKSSGGGFDTTQLINSFVKDNAFDEMMVEMSTHPRKIVSISSSSSVTVDLTDIRFLNWQPIWPTSIVYNGVNTVNSISGTTRSGSVYTVNFTGGVSGNVILTASSNTDAA